MHRMHHRMVGPLRTVCRTNLNLAKYTRLLAAPEHDALRMVTAGQSRRSRLRSVIQEKLRDSSSRLAGDAGTVPNVYVGGQQHPSPLARWSLRMKLVLVSDGKARAAGSRWHWVHAQQVLVVLTPIHLPF